MGTQPCLFTDVLSLTIWALQQQKWVVATGTVWCKAESMYWMDFYRSNMPTPCLHNPWSLELEQNGNLVESKMIDN